MTRTENLLTSLFRCGTADLSLLDDVRYDWDDIFENLEGAPINLNNIMYEVFQIGYADIQTAADDRIAELEAIALNERELDGDESAELDALRELNAAEDFDSYHNFLDTHVWCERHAEAYEVYLSDALSRFEENTGFEIRLY